MIAGMVAVHLNGTLARVIFSPTEDSPLVGVAELPLNVLRTRSALR